MAKIHCIYCGNAIYRERKMCKNCAEKLRLIRKIQRIVYGIRQHAEQEARHGKQNSDNPV